MSEKMEHEDGRFIILGLGEPDGGEQWGETICERKLFSTSSTGFYATAKMTDPETGDDYQIGCSIVKIGSKNGNLMDGG